MKKKAKHSEQGKEHTQKTGILWENLEHLCVAGIQAYFRNTVALVLDHHNKVYIIIKSVTKYFFSGYLAHIKVCSYYTVVYQVCNNSICKETVYIDSLIKRYLLLKMLTII